MKAMLLPDLTTTQVFTYDWYYAKVISYSFSGIIALADILIGISLKYISMISRSDTQTKFDLSFFKILWKVGSKFMYKLQFSTNALVPLSMSLITLNLFGRAGLMQTIDGIFQANIVLIPLVKLFLDIPYIYKLWKKKLIRDFVREGKGGPYTLHEALETYRKMNWQISYRYAYMFKSFAMCIFYSSVYPLGVLYTIPILLIYYWIEKYRLVRRSNKLVKYSNYIAEQAFTELRICLVLFCVSTPHNPKIGIMLKEFLTNLYNLSPLMPSIWSSGLLFCSLLFYLFPTIYSSYTKSNADSGSALSSLSALVFMSCDP